MRILSRVLLFLVFAIPALAQAATLRVPSQYATIQTAINAARSGDTVEVSAGTYRENVLITLKTVSLVAIDGPGRTTIDGGGVARVVTVLNTGSKHVGISGFTLKNGVARGDSANPVAPLSGGAIYAENANVLINGNTVTGNVGCLGSAMFLLESKASLFRNHIVANIAESGCASEAVMLVANRFGESSVAENVIADHQMSGIALQGAGKVFVRRNIIRNNNGTFPTLMSEFGGMRSVSTELVLEDNLFLNNVGISVGGVLIGPSDNNVPIIVSSNSFGGNVGTGGNLASALQLNNFAVTDFLIRGNLFDTTTNNVAVSCSTTAVISKDNVFVSPDSALSSACISQ